MATDSRIRNKPASLIVQVTHAERALLDRERLVVIRASSLDQSLRRRLTSPVMLLFAGGLGIFVEGLTKRQASAPDDATPPRALRGKLLPRLLKIIAIARVLGAAFPVEHHQRHGTNEGDRQWTVKIPLLLI